MDIIWNALIGYPNYEVSDSGTVRNKISGRHLKPAVTTGYHQVTITDAAGKSRRVFVHRLVATAFLPPPTADRTRVNHKDGNKTGNCADNLEWVTTAENNRHARETGLRRDTLAGRKRQPIIGTDLTTGEETWYPSTPVAAQALGLSPDGKGILAVLDCPARRAGNHRWRRAAHGKTAPDEVWAPVPKCDGVDLAYLQYEVSTKGRIRRIGAVSLMNNHKDAAGYSFASLTVSPGKGRPFRVHRLVATAFIPNPESGGDVDHIDGDPSNNNVENLQWMTRRKHTEKTHGKAVVKLDDAGNILERHATIGAAARSVGRPPTTFGKDQLIRKAFVRGVPGFYLEKSLAPNSTAQEPDMGAYLDVLLGN